MSDNATSAPLATPTDVAVSEFAHVASDERIERAAAALASVGMSAMVVASGEEARLAVENLLPYGAEVFNNTSRTLEAIGIAEDIERSGRYQPLRLRLYQMDREMQQHEMRQLAASPTTSSVARTRSQKAARCSSPRRVAASSDRSFRAAAT